MPPTASYPTTSTAEAERLLRLAASEIRRQWHAALDRSDFAEIDRWIHAGQAVHRALIALADR